MPNGLTATTTIHVKAPAEKVWDALTNPYLIKQYFFGTDAISDWRVGSSLIFKGEWEGRDYIDKGTILQSIPNQLFQYTYLSSMSGLADVSENYATINYILVEEADGTRLTVMQDNVKTEQAKEHSEKNWNGVLESLKQLVEKPVNS
jgi:uncharacterized protein YndB with AHSA1/START domain